MASSKSAISRLGLSGLPRSTRASLLARPRPLTASKPPPWVEYSTGSAPFDARRQAAWKPPGPSAGGWSGEAQPRRLRSPVADGRRVKAFRRPILQLTQRRYGGCWRRCATHAWQGCRDRSAVSAMRAVGCCATALATPDSQRQHSQRRQARNKPGLPGACARDPRHQRQDDHAPELPRSQQNRSAMDEAVGTTSPPLVSGTEVQQRGLERRSGAIVRLAGPAGVVEQAESHAPRKGTARLEGGEQRVQQIDAVIRCRRYFAELPTFAAASVMPPKAARAGCPGVLACRSR